MQNGGKIRALETGALKDDKFQLDRRKTVPETVFYVVGKLIPLPPYNAEP